MTEPAENIDDIFEVGDVDNKQTDAGDNVDDKPNDSKANEAEENKGEGDNKSTPPVDKDSSKADQGVYKAMKAEQRKRQDVEAELQALKNSNESNKETPDVLVDPEGYIDSRFADQQRNFDNRILNISENNARSRYDDFEAKKDYFFNELKDKNPELMQEALSQPDPYDFIYNTAKQRLEIDEIGDVGAYKDKLKAELLVELKEEMKGGKHADIEAAIEKRLKLPGSLSNERAAGGNSNPEFKKPHPDSYFDE